METKLTSNDQYDIAEGLLTEPLNLNYEDDEVVIVSDMKYYSRMVGQEEVPDDGRMGWIEVLFCMEGSMQWQLNGMLHQTSKNTVVVVPSRIAVEHMMVSLDAKMVDICLSNQMLHRVLGMDIDAWHKMVYQGETCTLQLTPEDMIRIVQYLQLMRLNGNMVGSYYRKVVHSFVKIMIYTIMNRCVSISPSVDKDRFVTVRTSHSKHLFDDFLVLLHQTKPKRHPIGYYAEHLTISPKYLSNICIKYSGKTAAMWIQEAVQEEVRYYLKQTLLSMKDVAKTTGFENVAFFGKYVKHHFGCTPLAYRRMSI